MQSTQNLVAYALLPEQPHNAEETLSGVTVRLSRSEKFALALLGEDLDLSQQTLLRSFVIDGIHAVEEVLESRAAAGDDSARDILSRFRQQMSVVGGMESIPKAWDLSA